MLRQVFSCARRRARRPSLPRPGLESLEGRILMKAGPVAGFNQEIAALQRVAPTAVVAYGQQAPCNGAGISTDDILQIMGTPRPPAFRGNSPRYPFLLARYQATVAQQQANAAALAAFLNSPEAKQDGLTTTAEVATFLGEVRAETTARGTGAGLTALSEQGSSSYLAHYKGYQGRGDLMTTGARNYERASLALFGDDRLLRDPGLLASDPYLAAQAAGFFWKDNNLSRFADQGNIDRVSIGILGKGALKKHSYDASRLLRAQTALNAMVILANCNKPPASTPLANNSTNTNTNVQPAPSGSGQSGNSGKTTFFYDEDAPKNGTSDDPDFDTDDPNGLT